MSDLAAALQEIHEGQQTQDRCVAMIEEGEGFPVDEFSGVDLVVLCANGDAIIGRIGWGASGIHVDVRAFLEGEQVATDSFELAGTTSVMGVRT
jgi:hypothetical protein